MAGNITVKAGPNTLGVIPASGIQVGVPNYLQGSNRPLYTYANLTLPYSPNDPGLSYTYPNPGSIPHVTLAVKFFNLLNEPSTSIFVDVGSALAPSGAAAVVAECLDVRNYGAVGDGITNDTAAIQCALDQAARNYTAQQSALAQGQKLLNPGPTIVCIPSGYTFMVGGQFWQSTCGRAWGTNGNWPVNPYDFAANNMPSWIGSTKQVGWFTGGPALYVRSGVTVQLDGEVRLYPVITGSESMTIFGIIDDQVSDGSANNVTIQGSGVLDAAGDKLTAATIGLGYAIYAYVSQNLTLKGFTLKNSVYWGIQLYGGPIAWPALPINPPYTYQYPTVYTDASTGNILLDSLNFVDCSLSQPGTAPLYLLGCIFAVASGLTINKCSFTRCAKTAIQVHGKNIQITNNQFIGCARNPNLYGAQSTIMLGLLDGCLLQGNNIYGGSQPPANPYGSNGDIRFLMNTTPLKIGTSTYQPPPQYPIDYANNIQIVNNTIQFVSGVGIKCDGITTGVGQGKGGFYSNIKIMNNIFDRCWYVGLDWTPTLYQNTSGSYIGFPQLDGFNWNVDIGSNQYNQNGQGITRQIFVPTWPVAQDLIIGGQIFVSNWYGPLMGAAVGLFGGSSFFIGPFGIEPYPNLSTTGTMFVERNPIHTLPRVTTLVNGVPSYIPSDSVFNETPGGTVDGVNTVFTTQHQSLGGLVAWQTSQIPGVTPATNSTIAVNANVILGTNTFTISPPPPAGSTLKVSYRFSTIEGYTQNLVN